jgi:hypothetical protein
MRSKNLRLAASLAVLVGCSSDAASPAAVNPLSGTLAFSYSGGISGTFSASGAISAGTSLTGTYAVGARDQTNTGTLVVASLPRSTTTSDIVAMQIPMLTSGSSTVDVNCVATVCAYFVVLFGNADSGAGTYVQACTLTTGTLAIATISSSRATGTFSGTGECLSPTFAVSAFTVTGGTFDVAIIAAAP